MTCCLVLFGGGSLVVFWPGQKQNPQQCSSEEALYPKSGKETKPKAKPTAVPEVLFKCSWQTFPWFCFTPSRQYRWVEAKVGSRCFGDSFSCFTVFWGIETNLPFLMPLGARAIQQGAARPLELIKSKHRAPAARAGLLSFTDYVSAA